ncbi:MAG TPA: hypothetical protein VF749_02475 [Candidatus Acidoferrum sp.]
MGSLAVLGLMAREAVKRWRTFSVDAALHVHGVGMTVVALQRAVIRRVAVQTTRAGENRCNRAEGLKALLIISAVCLGASECSRWKLLSRAEQSEPGNGDTE